MKISARSQTDIGQVRASLIKLVIFMILVLVENNLCELVEDVDSDEVTRQLKVAEVCTKSIPEKNDEIT